MATDTSPLIDINNLAANGVLKATTQAPRIEAPVVDPTKTMPDAATSKLYYSRLDGNTFIFPWGKTARFENGQYDTDIKEEKEELDKMCLMYKQGKQFEINDEPLPVMRSTAVIMREVGGGGRQSGVVNSAAIAGMARGNR